MTEGVGPYTAAFPSFSPSSLPSPLARTKGKKRYFASLPTALQKLPHSERPTEIRQVLECARPQVPLFPSLRPSRFLTPFRPSKGEKAVLRFAPHRTPKAGATADGPRTIRQVLECVRR
jgi:hypothetical protein